MFHGVGNGEVDDTGVGDGATGGLGSVVLFGELFDGTDLDIKKDGEGEEDEEE